MPPGKAKATPTMTPVAIRKLVKDSIAEALEIDRAEVAARAAEAALQTGTDEQSDNKRECTWKNFKVSDPIKFKGTEGAVALIRWFEKTENVFLMCNCPDVNKVKFATGMLLDEAMSWWNSHAQPVGMENAYKLTWDQFKKLMTDKFCPRTEVQKLETEFYKLVTVGNDIETYFRKFQELAALCPTMVSDNEKLLEKFIGGLPCNISGNVIASKSDTLEEAIRMSQKLMAQVMKQENTVNNNNENKRKRDDNQGNDQVWKPNKGQEVFRAYAAGPRTKKRYTGNLPYCNMCNLHHSYHCSGLCGICKKRGHLAKDCRKPTNQRIPGSCFKCGNLGHLRKDCPELKNKKTKA
jgi:hypothetical protein